MSVLDDLRDHPRFQDPRDYRDPDVVSFHEAACDAARHAARHPEHYDGLPPAVADALNDINEAVARLSRQIAVAEL